MDLTYMPGELDIKNAKKSNGSDMKREHDSVDDFEHLDPDLSPGGDGHSKDLSIKDKLETKHDSNGHNLADYLTEGSQCGDLGFQQKPLDPLNTSSNHSQLDLGTEPPKIEADVDLHFDSKGKTSLLDFESSPQKSASAPKDKFTDQSASNAFISSEIASNVETDKHEIESLDYKTENNVKEVQESKTKDDVKHICDDEDEKNTDLVNTNIKSMKEDDALPQYERKYEHKESPEKEDYGTMGIEKDLESRETDLHKSDHQTEIPPPTRIEKPVTPEPMIVSHEPIQEFKTTKESDISLEEPKEKNLSAKEQIKSEPTAKAVTSTVKDNIKPTVKKISVSDLDDIIGPEDVFKRIGLDAWFTPERLHPKVEALVYWRDPKKSGVVFGGGMAILLSLCFMSLISVIAYSSLLALTGTTCFRIYKNILQAVQKTSEGHPFKEFLELELSLPQDKVREITDTAVVHINATVVELRRLFLVEDLIDSIKFGVCLWCLTYVGAIFNGMTLVILGFVALFTVPKIYENNKASIDQYIDMVRSKVAEITSKVKAAMPIGKKEPEKDKEQ